MDKLGLVSLFLQSKGDQDFSAKGELITDVKTASFDYTETWPAGSQLGSMFLTHAECAEAFKEKDFVVEAKLKVPGRTVGGGNLRSSMSWRICSTR